MTSGWWKIDSDSSQPESFKVTSPPLPVSLPVSADTWSMNSVPVVVTVKVTQRESGIRAAPKNASGLPKSVRPCAMRFHSSQDRPLSRGRGRRTVPCVVEPVDGHAAGRWREADVPDEGARQQVHASRAQPSDQRFD